uniref:Uncharacterized protein n=1 Tax=Romanomermis culicivorax TaxID=13658 RepID=A0A915HTM8_ROMCU
MKDLDYFLQSHKNAIRSMLIMPDKRRIITHDIDGILKVGLIKVTTNRNGRRQFVVGGGISGGVSTISSGIEDEESDEEDENDLEVEGVTLPGVADWSYVDPCDEIFVRLVDSNKELNKWEFASENETVVKSKILHSDPISCICKSRDSRYIITGSTDMSMKIWEVATSCLTQALVGHMAHIVKCDVDEKFRFVVSAAADNMVMTWDIQTGNNLAKFYSSTKSAVTALKISNDGYLAFTGYKDGWLHAWFTQTGQRLASFNAYLSINEILLTSECHRIILLLDQCQNFSVLCFHNCPVIRSVVEQADYEYKPQDYDRDRCTSHANDTPNAANDHKDKSDDIVMDPLQNTTEKLTAEFKKVRKNSKVFAPIERTRSKASIFDSPSTKFTAEKPSGQITTDKKTTNKESDGKENLNEKQSRSKFCCLL